MTDSDNPDKQLRVDRHLLGRADEHERLEFAEETARDAELANLHLDTKQAMAAIELAEDRALKARLRALEANLSGAAPAATTDEAAKVVSLQPLKRNRRILWAYAAAVLLLISVAWFALSGRGYDSPAALAMAEFEPYPNYAYPIERGAPGDEPEAAAFIAYEAGDYARATDEFAALPPEPKFQFYLAQSLLAQDRFAEAEPLFAAIATTDFPWAAEVAYYRGLAFLGLNDVAAARPLLERVSREAKSPLREQAREVLDQL